MRVLLDTNILLRVQNPNDGQHGVAVDAVEALLSRGHQLVLVPQILYEFWVVATRPTDVNGLGMKTDEVADAVDQFLNLYSLLRDERAIFDRWLDLVSDHAVRGVNAHDARLAAAMRRHRIDAILTFNVKHFRRFGQVKVLEPGAVTAGE